MATAYNCDLMQFFLAGTATTPGLAVIGDADTGVFSPAADVLGLTAGGVEFLRLTESTQDELVVNEAGVDIDTRIEASGAANAFFVQGSDGFVGLGTNAPEVPFHMSDGTRNASIQFFIVASGGMLAGATVGSRGSTANLNLGGDISGATAGIGVNIVAHNGGGWQQALTVLNAAGAPTVVINEGAVDMDSRIESDTSPGVFGTDGEGAGFAYFSPDPNGARMQIKCVSTTVTAAVGATVTATNLIPANAKFWGVTTRITTTLGATTGTTGYTVGDGVDADRWGTAAAVTSGTTTSLPTAEPSGFTLAAANVVLTATGGNFDGTGVVRVTVHYTDFAGPTS